MVIFLVYCMHNFSLSISVVSPSWDIELCIYFFFVVVFVVFVA